ncbi:MAG: IS256 family transposase [Verrucomicrobia bacterium]|nr:IS256 family transposase [Verrucomicrobiota bacterium]
MTHHTDPELLNDVLQLLTDQDHTGFAEGLRILVNEAMRVERHHVLQAQPYERTAARQGYANGYKPKTLASRVGPITFRIPQVRGEMAFYPSALEKGIRSEQALKLAMAEMYVQGVSTRKVSAIVEELCGTSVSSSQVSDCAKLLDAELQKWRDRPLSSCPYLVCDARYEKVRHDGQLRDCAVLIALGITPAGQRVILGVSVALSEAEVHWRAFFHSLVQRGLCGVTFIVSDDHPGMAAARKAVFGAVPWQRCQFHLQQNAQAYVPRLDQRAEVARAIRSVFDCPSRTAAEQRLKEIGAHYAQSAPKLVGWLEENLPQGFTVFTLPAAHQKRMRTSNALERVNQELKRRTRVARVFPNEKSLLRLISALLCETSDDWETGKIYLNMENQNPPSV